MANSNGGSHLPLVWSLDPWWTQEGEKSSSLGPNKSKSVSVADSRGEEIAGHLQVHLG